jgi:rhodanese-related sulfurtransferase
MAAPHRRNILSTALMLLALSGAARAGEGDARPTYVEPREVQTWLEAGRTITWLDVRQADEFAAGHIAGAANIPHDQVTSLAATLPHGQPIILYCIHSAHRAPEAAKTLRAAGFDDVSVLEGGIVAWREAGLPIQAADLANAPAILPYTERCSHPGDKASPPHGTAN